MVASPETDDSKGVTINIVSTPNQHSGKRKCPHIRGSPRLAIDRRLARTAPRKTLIPGLAATQTGTGIRMKVDRGRLCLRRAQFLQGATSKSGQEEAQFALLDPQNVSVFKVFKIGRLK
jgi:hypothetical protein